MEIGLYFKQSQVKTNFIYIPQYHKLQICHNLYITQHTLSVDPCLKSQHYNKCKQQWGKKSLQVIRCLGLTFWAKFFPNLISSFPGASSIDNQNSTHEVYELGEKQKCALEEWKRLFLTQPKFLHIHQEMADPRAQMPPEIPLTSLLKQGQVHCWLHSPHACCAASSLSRGTQRGAKTLDKGKVSYLNASVSPRVFFEQSLEAAQGKLSAEEEGASLPR